MNGKFTKIVATLGPSSNNEKVIRELIIEGVNVARLNFSHGSFKDHLNSVNIVRQISNELDKPIAIFQDLQGPKIRIGRLDSDFIELIDGEELILTTEDITGGISPDNTPGLSGLPSARQVMLIKKVPIDYKNLHNEAMPGDRILLDDGLLELKVDRIRGQDIITKVIHGGQLKPRKGVNLPNVKLKISAITEKDRSDLKFAFDNNLDYVALSFVRNSTDILELIEIMLKEYDRKIPIIAKIEKPEAYIDIDNIIKVSDAIMVARGDLGVETSPQEVPIMQKEIISKCNILGKPVITATQMLDSMINNPRPTRAEANDVANAILDGTDAIMLSGETASGKYPVESVKIMNDIAIQVESSDIFMKTVFRKNLNYEELLRLTGENVEEAVSFATVELAAKIGAKYIVTYTHSGGTARKISKYRPVMPIVAISPVQSAIRRMALIWGVTPIELGNAATIDDILEGAAEVLKFKEMVNEGDHVVITAGIPIGETR